MTDEHHAEQSHQAWRKANVDNYIEDGGYTEQAIFDMGWDAAQSAFAAREADLVGALGDVANPLGRLKREADEQGVQLSGMAYQIANDLEFVKSIATATLKSREASHG